MFGFKLIGDPTGKTNKFQCVDKVGKYSLIENPKSSGGGYTCTEMLKMK